MLLETDLERTVTSRYRRQIVAPNSHLQSAAPTATPFSRQTRNAMTKTVSLEVITEISGPTSDLIEQSLSNLIERIEELICGTVTVTNEE